MKLDCTLLVTICLAFSSAAAADNRCEADQLAGVGSYCKALLNCTVDHFYDPIRSEKCLNAAELSFQKRFSKAQLAAFKRGYDCAYNAELSTASNLFYNAGSVLAQDGLQGWQLYFSTQNRWYKSLLHSLAASCQEQLNIESRFAKDGKADKRLSALSKSQFNTQKKLDRLIARTSFAYAGLASDELLASLRLFSDNAVNAIRPQLGGLFGVSAQVMLADAIFIDSDTNNAEITPVSNSLFALAQPLPVPAMVGGFVNQAGFGDSFGNSYLTGDLDDVYRVSLTANQVINLSIGNAFADLDLYLYRQNDTTTAIANSREVMPFESLTVSEAGDYYVVVEAYSGAANYALSFGQQTGSSQAAADPEFVPGEMIVRMKKPAKASVAAAAASPAIQARQMAEGLGFDHLGGAGDREMLWKLSDNSSQRRASLQSLGAQSSAKTASASTASKLADDTLAAVKALRKRADVASADLNYIRRASAVPSDPYYPRQWHYPLISLPAAWDVSNGQNTVVAVIDTGVLLNHPDLQGQFVDGYDFISNPNVANDGNGIDANADDPGDNPGGSHSYHGTHVAGTIAATSNNPIGGAGVAWNAKIMPLRVLGVGGGTDYDIIQAMRYAARLSNDSGTLPTRKADVINLSLGGSGSSSAAQLTVNEVRNAGVIIVAAAGNEKSHDAFYPAAYQGVVSVSAVDTQKHLAPYSNYGSSIDIAAPGGDTSKDRNGDGFTDGILSTLASGDAAGNNLAYTYQYYQGTSMATPHVAGVIALMKEVNPALTPSDFDSLLSEGKLTEDIGRDGRDDQFGHGLINAQLAVGAAGGSQSAAPKLGTAPTGLNFGANQTPLSLNLFNAGAGELNVSLIQSDQPWLSIEPTSVDAHLLGSYSVSVNRSGLADGVYNATITVSSSAGNLSIPVLMRVGGTMASDTGLSYFLLVNNTTGQSYQVEVLPSEGVYQLNFSNIPKGEYLLLGGTDMDNDGYLCSDGELCGAYPSIERLAPITIQGDVANLVFTANFPQSLQSTDSLQAKLGPELAQKLVTSRGIARVRRQNPKTIKSIGGD